jgi:hypothetical protein
LTRSAGGFNYWTKNLSNAVFDATCSFGFCWSKSSLNLFYSIASGHAGLCANRFRADVVSALRNAGQTATNHQRNTSDGSHTKFCNAT